MTERKSPLAIETPFNPPAFARPRPIQLRRQDEYMKLHAKHEALVKVFKGLLYCQPCDLKYKVRQTIFKMGL